MTTAKKAKASKEKQVQTPSQTQQVQAQQVQAQQVQAQQVQDQQVQAQQVQAQQVQASEELSIKEVFQKEGKFPGILLFVSASILIFLDQWTKMWAVKALFLGTILPESPRELYTKKIEVFSWWNYQLVGNKGAAWGMFGNLPDGIRLPFFTVIGVIAVVGIFIFYYRSYQQFLMRISLISIFAGAIGNIIDRMTIGYVIDFIDWHYHGYHWPTFNVADIAISVGVGLMLVQMILETIYPPMRIEANSSANNA